MQISLKLSRAQKHTKLTLYIQFPPLMIFSLSFIGASVLPIFARSVLYLDVFNRQEGALLNRFQYYQIQKCNLLRSFIEFVQFGIRALRNVQYYAIYNRQKVY